MIVGTLTNAVFARLIEPRYGHQRIHSFVRDTLYPDRWRMECHLNGKQRRYMATELQRLDPPIATDANRCSNPSCARELNSARNHA